jgi:membrane protease subunit (stomatin/prohibitin family)
MADKFLESVADKAITLLQQNPNNAKNIIMGAIITYHKERVAMLIENGELIDTSA